MSAKAPPPEERFKANLLNLANIMSKELNIARGKGVNTVSENVLELGVSLIKGTPGNIIIGGFITRSFPADKSTGLRRNVWDEVFTENDAFFIENSKVIFGELSEGIVGGFKVLLENKSVSPSLMKIIWKHLIAMVKTSLHFIYIGREPVVVSNDDGYKITYQKEFYPFVRLEEEAARWNVNLMSSV